MDFKIRKICLFQEQKNIQAKGLYPLFALKFIQTWICNFQQVSLYTSGV